MKFFSLGRESVPLGRSRSVFWFWPTYSRMNVGRSTTTKTKPIIHQEHVEGGQRLRTHPGIQHPIQLAHKNECEILISFFDQNNDAQTPPYYRR